MEAQKETISRIRNKSKNEVNWKEIGVALAVNAANGIIMGLTSAAIYRATNPRTAKPNLALVAEQKDFGKVRENKAANV